MKTIVFFDAEINPENGQILDIGAVDSVKRQFHSAQIAEFSSFIKEYDFIAGHNIIAYDLKYLEMSIPQREIVHYIDTLCLSPLLFPAKPYHRLLKDDKLQTDSLSNPLDDAIKSFELFCDEVAAFETLNDNLKQIWYLLLHDIPGFSGFFPYLDYSSEADAVSLIQSCFEGNICANAPLSFMVRNHPLELAYCLALISADDRHSITPPWVQFSFPLVDNYMRLLRNQPCEENCPYCMKKLDVRLKLKEIFGFPAFRTYEGEPLQEKAADAAVHNRSLLAIFPTGGGKSITFQLPALMAGENAKGLTVVISPLQSLMKDQVDNLARLGIADAVTINGLLSPIERAEAFQRVQSGLATLLYLSPESLRSRTIEKLLLSRNVVRFVIDEAHCFSAWGQDFRVDYLYIGDFIRQLQEKKNINYQIPVSCFTATAKQKVIEDIRDYFKMKLGLELELFATSAARTNLRYEVLYQADDNEKYEALRRLIEQKDCPTIVYVSRTKRTVQIAEKLTADGLTARPFHGKMESSEKVVNQEAFISGEVQIIVATSAFGMGVDKKDVGLVVHFDISDSLENYIQEAGRAGRDPSLSAECYVLFNETDLDSHFIRLNQTKLSQSEIQQVWRAIKKLAGKRPCVSRSALEIAREAGWNEDGPELETRLKTAIAALENAGYIQRGQNIPHVYATSILVKTMDEASQRIHTSSLFDARKEQNALRIMKSLISERSRSKQSGEAESRIDYLADMLALTREEVIEAVNLLRQEKILADTQDMSAYIKRSDSQNKSMQILKRYMKLEFLLLNQLKDEPQSINLKEINEQAEQQKIKGASIKCLTTILFYWTIRGFIRKCNSHSEKARDIIPKIEISKLTEQYLHRIEIAMFIVEFLYDRAAMLPANSKGETLVNFSALELMEGFNQQLTIENSANLEEIQDALLYLSQIESLSLEGGFLVLYQSLSIRRLEMDNRIQYKQEDYKQLNDFYQQKIQMIHIVGEYANMMVRDYNEALQFVSDYFQMDYKAFLCKYFKGNRLGEINRNITPQKYNELMGTLSDRQREIIDDETSQYIVVAAGPGSGKTMVLVHKLAALVMLDDVKYEQLLMLTFSRAAATEFKSRLRKLIGNAAKFIEIKTFHSYCFDLLGKIGSLEHSDQIVPCAVNMIRSGEVEQIRITKTIVVIDEAQDMDQNEYELICALMECNTNIRVIAVGDDDQNIYGFRGSNSGYMRILITEFGAKQYDLTDNYRSTPEIISFANRFVQTIQNRLKSEPIIPVRKDIGTVLLTRHKSLNLEYPIVQNIISNRTSDKKICVLTWTNDEALRVNGLLRQMKIPSKLIQSNDGFSLYDLAELRMFLKLTTKNEANPIISDEQWKAALSELKRIYCDSHCLDLVCNLLNTFAEVNEKKYRSDLESFIRESQLSDFEYPDDNEIVVSTIHKAKGHEFDNVYIMLNQFDTSDDERKRALYVGMTRAKSELYLHYNNHVFDDFHEQIIDDPTAYPEPDHIMLQLTHRDVVLNYFMDKKAFILNLRSGDSLTMNGKLLYATKGSKLYPVAMLSKAAQGTIANLYKKGYQIQSARIRFVVAWRNQDEHNGKEYAIILPDVFFEKNKKLKSDCL